MLRRFTALATENCDLLGLTLSDLLKMKLEFPEQFKEIVDSNGMEIISQTPFSFESVGGWNGNDCISFFRKPI